MNVTEFLGRLQRVKKQRDGWLASCPSHGEDKNPSLSIKEGDDGRILVNCFAGCGSDAILSAMTLQPSDLFPEKPVTAKRTIQATYDYKDADGTLLFQAVRYSPKGFSQRRPDGKGGWLFDLKGVTRVLYRLPDLKGRQAILFCEGEKDVEAAMKLGIPATCNPMGAGKWDPAYVKQLQSAGVVRVAVIPDNDEVGRAHAATVAASLHAAGIEVRVPELPGLSDHGDLSDYIAAGRTGKDLSALLKATAIWGPNYSKIIPAQEETPDRHFAAVGERRYRLVWRSAGVTIDVDELRSHRDGMTGELTFRVNGQFPTARTYRDGIISMGDFNFTSVQARQTRAKLVAERSGDSGFDWFGLLEEFVIEVVTHERQGDPPVVLGEGDDVPEDDAESETWDVEGFPILTEDPMVIFGDSSGGKSYLALWLVGVLAQRGIKVLYIDWEFSKKEHRKRLRRLFQPTPKNLHYLRVDAPIVKEARRLARLVADEGYQYVVCDSIGFAVDGPAETHEAARGYFAALRSLGVGSLSLAHIAKSREHGQDATIFGSAFFRAGARSAWFVDRATENAPGELHIGLHHRKANSSDLRKPMALRFSFTHQKVKVERADIRKVESLVSQLPLVDRMQRALQNGPLTLKDLCEELDTSAGAMRSMLSRHKSKFVKFGNKINRKDDAVEF